MIVETVKLEGDTYHTEPRSLSFFERNMPPLVFYQDVISIVVRASRKAKRNRYDTSEWCNSSIEVLRALERVGVQLEVTGMNFFKTLDSPCVFIGNHMSTFETFVLPTIIAPFRETTFVVKQDLIEYPIFKYVMRARNPVTVGRLNPRDDLKAVLEGGTERLRAGSSIIIFPQTTRSPRFDPDQFNTIGIKLAKKAEAPVVPIALKTDAWGTGNYLKDYGRINPKKKAHIAFGEPLRVKDRGAEEHQKIVEFITGKLRGWNE